MRRFFIPSVLAGCFALFLTSCDPADLEQPVQIRAFSIGYDAENEDMSSRFEDSRFSDRMFSAFNSQADIDAAQKQKEEGFDINVETSRFNYESEATFKIKTIPENAMVKGVQVTSSNKDVLEIVKISGKEVTVALHDVGETVLSVHVQGAVNDMSNEYPLRIVTPVRINFSMTPYWFGRINTRLRMRAKSLPMGLKSITSVIQDSVTVIGYCEYYDVYNHGRTPQVKRDTITFGKHEHTGLIKKNKNRTLRNITSAIRDIRGDWSVKGSRIVQNGNQLDTVSHHYGYVVEQVILDFNVFGANPYYEYYFSTKCDRTTDVIVVDEKTGEPTGEIADSGTDDEEDFDEEQDEQEIKREDSAFFTIRFNDFLSQSQRDSLCLDLKSKLDAIDYDDSKLTDEEKERRLKDIEDKKKDDEK